MATSGGKFDRLLMVRWERGVMWHLQLDIGLRKIKSWKRIDTGVDPSGHTTSLPFSICSLAVIIFLFILFFFFFFCWGEKKLHSSGMFIRTININTILILQLFFIINFKTIFTKFNYFLQLIHSINKINQSTKLYINFSYIIIYINTFVFIIHCHLFIIVNLNIIIIHLLY